DYVAPLGRGVRGLRVGVPRDYFFEGVDPEVEKGFEQALATLRQLGATVEDVQIPNIQSAGAFMAIMLSEAFAYHERDLREHPELFGELLRERLLAGALITGSEYVQAQRIRTLLQADMNAALRRVDVLATPTSPKPAATFAQVYDPDYGFPRGNTGPFNMTGLPSLAVPCGFTTGGLPISLQITGRPFDETTVLRVGHTYEQATDWHKPHPPPSAPDPDVTFEPREPLPDASRDRPRREDGPGARPVGLPLGWHRDGDHAPAQSHGSRHDRVPPARAAQCREDRQHVHSVRAKGPHSRHDRAGRLGRDVGAGRRRHRRQGVRRVRGAADAELGLQSRSRGGRGGGR